jgi:hypothetical protein
MRITETEPTGIPEPDARKRPSSVKDVDAFMQLARERYAFALAQDATDRGIAEEDVQFVGADGNQQWTPKALAKRKKNKLPILSWNRLPVFVAQIVNDGRENKPSIRASAMDGGSKHTAEFFQDRIRHLEYECDADIAYDTARRHQVVSGRGFLRVSTAYKPKSFDQRLSIDAIENQFAVLCDPAATRYDRRDADWWFVSSIVSRDGYERKYGKDTAAAAANYFASGDNPAPDWVGIGANGEMIQVAEYWLKVYEKRTLCLLEDLTAVYADEMTAKHTSPVMDTREDDVCKVMQYIIDGVGIVDETEWIGSYVPIVPMWGEQMVIDGERRNYSLVRMAKDPQRLVNLYVSNIAQEIAAMPKNPYIGVAGQFLGFEEDWKKMNEEVMAFIEYNDKGVNGQPIGPPTRETNEPPIQALTIGLNQAIDAMKAAMGIYDASLGSGPGDTAGIAIQKRQKESDVANFHFSDNEARTRKHLGRILLELIPIIDKGPREVPTRTEEGKVKLVKVNTAYRDDKTGKMMVHNLSQGNYEPAISTGPSYTSARQQANDAYAQIAASDKNFMTIAGDLYFRTSDMPGADAIADRYEKMLPPQLKPAPPPGEAQMQQQAQALQQLSAQHQQLLAQVHSMATIIEQKQVEAASREKIAEMHEATKLAIAEITAKSQTMERQQADRLADLETRNAMLDRAHEHALATLEGQRDAQGQQADQQHQIGMQQAAQQQQQQQPQPQATP